MSTAASAALGLSACVTSPPSTQPVTHAAPVQTGPPCPAAGVEIKTSIGGIIRGGGHLPGDPAVCLFNRTDGRPPAQAVYGFAAPSDVDYARAIRRVVGGIWPPAVGKSAEADVLAAHNGQGWRQSLSILRREWITVPAGTFDTWVVGWRQEGFASNIHLSERMYWFTVDGWLPVKRDVHLIRGTTTQRPWEAVSIIGLPASPQPVARVLPKGEIAKTP